MCPNRGRACRGAGHSVSVRAWAFAARQQVQPRDLKCQTVCKPGSVWPQGAWTVIPLGPALRRASRNQPERRGGRTPEIHADFGRSYSVLLPVGFALPPLLPSERCALTAPFHPYLQSVPWFPMADPEGGLFSVALSLRSPSPVVNRHRSPVEPGLSSITHLHTQQRPSDRLARAPCGGRRRRSRGQVCDTGFWPKKR